MDERPRVLLEDVDQDGAWVVGTDFTSFEASFTKPLMMACEIELYAYMVQLLSDKDFIKVIKKVLPGVNMCHFRRFSLRLIAKRMSGEMVTSLGNSFTNLMAFLFVAYKMKCQSVKGKVDGDDGLFSGFGPKPTPEYFNKLGLDIKIVDYPGVTLGSFCGMVMDPEDLINITDPIEVLINAGWTTREYRNAKTSKLMGLLKCKGYSYLYQYTGCPIIDSLARYILRVTKEFEFRIPASANAWQKNKLTMLFDKYKMKLPYKITTDKTRYLMEKNFKVTYEDQVRTEKYLDSLNCVQPLKMPWLLQYCHKDNFQMWDKYIFDSTCGTIDFIGDSYRLKSYCSALSLFDIKQKN